MLSYMIYWIVSSMMIIWLVTVANRWVISRKAKHLFKLSKNLRRLFEESRQRKDIDASIDHGRKALKLLPDGYAWHSELMDILGTSLHHRYEQWGEMHDLDDSITFYRSALLLRPVGHRDGALSLNNLANALLTRFGKSGRDKDLEDAIELQRSALDLRPEGHPDRAPSLNDLASSLLTRFEQSGRDKDLEDAIIFQRSALDLCPEGHKDRAMSLNNLSASLLRRFEQSGRYKDLEDAIILQRSALDLCPEGHPDRAASLSNHANSLLTRFEQNGRNKDLEDAIALQRSALDLSPEGHTDRAMSLNNLANSLLTRVEQSGSDKDLEDAIAFQRSALDLRPEGHPLRSSSLNNLANSLLTRFEQRGSGDDLEHAIAFQRSALELRPDGHPLRSSSLNNLAKSLLMRFEQSGRNADLEDAIALQHSALHLFPGGSQNRVLLLNNLANSLLRRFVQSGIYKDLEDAIAFQRSALELRPEGHLLRSTSLNNLAKCLYTRFKQSGSDKDLEDAIALQRSAIDLRPEGHPLRSSSLNNLANSLLTLFEQRGSDDDLEDAILLQRSALDLCPEGHPLRSTSLNNLANILFTRCRQSVRDKDLEDGMTSGRTDLNVVPEGHPRLSICSSHAASNFSSSFSADFEEAIQLLRSASIHTYSRLLSRFAAANRWASLARTHSHATTLEAYEICTSLMERSLTLRHDLQSQHDLLVEWAGDGATPCDAASYAIASGELERAVELLERGRGLLWSQMRGYRTRLDKLEGMDKTLAVRFGDVARELERLAISSGAQIHTEPIFDIDEHGAVHLDEIFARKRRLTMEQEEIIGKIREISGFEDFLRPTAFATLRKAADEGPVIIINTCEFHSDALLILPGDADCVCIPLDGEFYADATELTKMLLATRREFGPSSPKYEDKLLEAMKILWDKVVCRVVEKLDELGISKGSRIWWCPTSVLTALPFHAAGPFTDADGMEKYLLDDYVSSYTPTLRSLIDARSGYRKGKLTTLVVEDPGLSTAQAEVDAIHEIGMKPTVLVGEEANHESVMEKLQETRWIHFTCHGRLNPKPFNCSFQLSNGGLTLLDIMTARPPKAELAFLSACHSAEQSPGGMKDEVLHLAAAIQFCGFRSVIGTMWQLADGDGPAFARDVYSYMSRKVEGEPRFKRAAAALRGAAVNLKAQKDVSAERWVNMVHIGA